MDIASTIFLAVVVLMIFYLINIYNHLVRIKHNVSKAWSNIDVLLKQRHDEIPKLVETCKQYMKFEQDTLEKVEQLQDPSISWHMIGHLQSNKVKQAVRLYDCIQSVDSLKLAVAIEEQAAKRNRSIDILIQVNTTGEQQKFGIAPSGVFAFIEQVIGLKHVRLQGLMTVAPLVEDKEVVRKCFRDLRLLRDGIVNKVSGRLRNCPRGRGEYGQDRKGNISKLK